MITRKFECAVSTSPNGYDRVAVELEFQLMKTPAKVPFSDSPYMDYKTSDYFDLSVKRSESKGLSCPWYSESWDFFYNGANDENLQVDKLPEASGEFIIFSGRHSKNANSAPVLNWWEEGYSTEVAEPIWVLTPDSIQYLFNNGYFAH